MTNKDNLTYIILSTFFILILGATLLYFPKAEMHLWMNQCHNGTMDIIMKYYTQVGEWIPYVMVFLLLFYKAGWATFLLTNIALSGLIAQRLKYVFDTDRPYLYFANHFPDVQLQFVDGVELSKFYSFPSGHTTTFFALFFTLSLVVSEIIKSRCNLPHLPHNTSSTSLSNNSPILPIQTTSTLHTQPPYPQTTNTLTTDPLYTLTTNTQTTDPLYTLTTNTQTTDPLHTQTTNPLHTQTTNTLQKQTIIIILIQAVCFLLTLVGAYSRIYLSQHFAEDIFGGALLGLTTSMTLTLFTKYINNTKFWEWNLLKLYN